MPSFQRSLIVLSTVGILVTGAAAQKQFAEQTTPYMPQLRDAGAAIAAADVDGDGDQDLFVGNNGIASGGQNRLYLNDGKGEFKDASTTHLPAGTYRTASVALGDVDGDGDVDVITANSFQNRLYLNNGSGVFHDATFGRMPIDVSECRKVLLRDLDKDGDLDVVFASYRQELLYLNNGSGVFTDVTPTHMVVNQTSTWGLDAADIDGDGDVDLILAEQNGHVLLLNDGTAHFSDVTAARLPATTALCQAATFGDVDGDGDLDLLSAFWRAPMALYLNNGSGKFTDATSGRLASSMISVEDVVIGDVDGDTDLDIVLTGWFDRFTPAVRLQLNDGAGKFSDVTTTQVHSNAVVYTGENLLVDVDGDGDLDLATAEWAQRDRLLFNDGKGIFVDATPCQLYALSDVPRDAALADLDGDGDLDLVFANGFYEWQSWPNRLHRNDGRGRFTDVTLAHLPNDSDDSRAVVFGDVDRDGDIDLVFGNYGGQNTLYLNNGSAVFTDSTASRMPAAKDATTSLALGDVDGDGYPDLIVGNHLEQVRLYINDKTGAFQDVTATQLPVASFETRALALGDVNGDGHLDLFLAAGLTQFARNRLYLNDGKGKFSDVTTTHLPNIANSSSCVALGDMDGDGDLDAVFGNDSLGTGTPNRLYRNNGNGTFGSTRMVYDLDNTKSVALLDVDEDGDLDAVFGVYDFVNKLDLNDGNGNFSAGPGRMPGVLENTRVLVAGDIDADGDIDFIAGNSGPSQLESVVYANHLRQISAQRRARLGKAWTVDVYSRAGFATVPQLAMVFVGLVPASIPLPPHGRLGLDPTSMVILPSIGLPAPSGKGSTTVLIPPVAALVGSPLYAQGGVLPTANPADARLTNVLMERIGGY